MFRKLTPQQFLDKGVEIIEDFVSKNPRFRLRDIKLHNINFSCGFYEPKDGSLHIDLKRTGRLGFGGMAWSWPGYKIDRTPFGVIVHEFGHHCDYTFSPGGWTFARSAELRALKRGFPKEKVSGYEPNLGEVFAESFRVYATNPALLRAGAPHSTHF